MTLYKQLLTWMLVVFFLLMSAVFFVDLTTTRNFLLSQQAVEISNASTAVGLALSPYLETGDKVAAESVINAMFDGGLYSNVTLTFLRDEEVIELQYQTQFHDVPNWFTSLNIFSPYTYTEPLTSGWLQLGELSITGHPGYAYRQLWQALVQLSISFLVIFGITSLVLALLLGYILRPLDAIRERANEMARNKFGEPLSIPKTLELRAVVNAFNHMSNQLKQYFEDQAKEADKLRVRAYQDQVSGLGNRSFLVSQLESWSLDAQTGGFAILSADLIEESYINHGYEEGDKLVIKLAERLNQLVEAEYTIARLSQKEFAIIAPNIGSEELRFLGQSMLHMVLELQNDPLGVTPPQAAVGLVLKTHKQVASETLAEADNALSRARQTPSEPIAMVTGSDVSNTLGKQEWKALLEEAIANQLFTFKYQKACNQQGETLHHEVFASIEKNNELYSAGQFLGAVEQLNIGSSLDTHIIEVMLRKLKADPLMGPLTINLTVSSICDTSFMHWLANMMRSNKSMSKRLFFELPEIVFVKYSSDAILLCEIIHQNEFQFGIDNYGHHFSSLDYLKKLRPSYVKLDFAYTTQLDNETKADVLASVSRTAMQLNITTIATRVETEKQLNKLSDLFINGFQGFVFERPEANEA